MSRSPVRPLRAVLSLLRVKPWPALLLASGLGWCGLVWLMVSAETLGDICRGIVIDGESAGPGGFSAAVTGSLPAFLIGWAIMLLAMIPPVLAMPLRTLSAGCLPQRRRRTSLLFLSGVALIWLAAGPLLAILATLLHATEPRGVWLPFLPVAAVVLIWQASPWKQIALNRCHRVMVLRWRGAGADLDCLRYGLRDAFACLCSCWALMLVPLLAGDLHLVAMAVIGGIMVQERLAPAGPARWRLPFVAARAPILPAAAALSGAP